eukprot:COSAG01_NODE_4553_length_4929_cov_16.517805_2_plen_94_part_00
MSRAPGGLGRDAGQHNFDAVTEGMVMEAFRRLQLRIARTTAEAQGAIENRACVAIREAIAELTWPWPLPLWLSSGGSPDTQASEAEAPLYEVF